MTKPDWSTNPARPDAIIGLFEGASAGIVQAATALDLTIPSDVQVAQDIDDASTHTVAPSITALDQHADAQAQAAWAASADLVELGVVRGIVEPTG
ncbi:substrate-binding domain-containing protein [Streptomyces sp. NPDC002405]|uniref:substrate-binding domain-containing protein n=1 Tax=Streptomyces sp. NPDC001231 TaxID=3364549 RepID=UPI00367A98E0